jgi:hypothetical protein
MDTGEKEGKFSKFNEEGYQSPNLDLQCRDRLRSWKVAKRSSQTALSNPWVRRSLRHPPGRGNLVGYIRYTSDPWDSGRQLERLQDYCARHGYRIEKAFEDQGKPSLGLARALEALDQADGIIAVDLDRFVEHEGDKTRDLRPLIHEFLCLGNKHLITIKEGIDTGSAAGQQAAIELINQPRNHGLDLD